MQLKSESLIVAGIVLSALASPSFADSGYQNGNDDLISLKDAQQLCEGFDNRVNPRSLLGQPTEDLWSYGIPEMPVRVVTLDSARADLGHLDRSKPYLKYAANGTVKILIRRTDKTPSHVSLNFTWNSPGVDCTTTFRGQYDANDGTVRWADYCTRYKWSEVPAPPVTNFDLDFSKMTPLKPGQSQNWDLAIELVKNHDKKKNVEVVDYIEANSCSDWFRSPKTKDQHIVFTNKSATTLSLMPQKESQNLVAAKAVADDQQKALSQSIQGKTSPARASFSAF